MTGYEIQTHKAIAQLSKDVERIADILEDTTKLLRGLIGKLDDINSTLEKLHRDFASPPDGNGETKVA